jgi:hypothetical protein
MASVRLLAKQSVSQSKSKNGGNLKSNENSLTRFKQNSNDQMIVAFKDNHL